MQREKGITISNPKFEIQAASMCCHGGTALAADLALYIDNAVSRIRKPVLPDLLYCRCYFMSYHPPPLKPSHIDTNYRILVLN